MSHRRMAAWVIVSAWVLAGILGVIHSLVQPRLSLLHAEFCATANAVTDGCDRVPSGWGYLVTWLEFILVVPLFGATFSLFTSWLTSDKVITHVDKRHEEMKSHVSNAIGGSNGEC